VSVQEVLIENGLVRVRRAWDFHGGAGLAATVGAVPNAVAFEALCKQVLAWGDDDPVRPGMR
jgi:hypothetical protein